MLPEFTIRASTTNMPSLYPSHDQKVGTKAMLSPIQAKFSRRAPASLAKNNGIPLGWVCVSWRWVSNKRVRRTLYGHWAKIKSDHGKCYRILRFSGSLRGTPGSAEGEIVLDWSAWLALPGYDENCSALALDLKIQAVSWYEMPFVGISHPDPTYRLANLLAYLALLLAVFSLFT